MGFQNQKESKLNVNRELDMKIYVFQNELGEIEIKDSAGIKILSVNEKHNYGLWLYFNTRLDQYVK